MAVVDEGGHQHHQLARVGQGHPGGQLRRGQLLVCSLVIIVTIPLLHSTVQLQLEVSHNNTNWAKY